ncbi:aminotransferase class I/II-fold pyridoxal phosphate-dependent enzyme [Erwinia billingiae]|uniref:aminotransferase class I/II-fold pyridoxal phosphate-dependent enzyme n=1 Tax=Erwinia billingiae TaxID=182337 RepID=UPI00320B65E6
MPDFAASQLVEDLEENLFGVLEKLAANVDGTQLPLIDLSSGSPRQPTPPEIIASLQSAAEDPGNHEYSSFWGKPQIRAAIAAFYLREYGVELDPDREIAVFQGSHIAVSGIPRALLNPGQVLISTDPCYPLYRSAARQSQADFYGIPLDESNGFLPDFSRVPEDIARRGGLLVLNYPHNPTGAMATPALFQAALEFAESYHLPLLHDFAYASIGSHRKDRPISLLSQPGAKQWGVEVYTMSKSFLMAGWRFGFAVGNASIISAFKKLHTHSYSTVYGAVQDAAVTALELQSERIDALADIYHQRREQVFTRLAEMNWPVRKQQGTFFLWLPVPDGFSGEDFVGKLLHEAHVLVAPGDGFGEHASQYIRISLTVQTELLMAALDRIAALELFAG